MADRLCSLEDLALALDQDINTHRAELVVEAATAAIQDLAGLALATWPHVG